MNSMNCSPFCWAVARGWAALCCQKSRSSSAKAKDSRSTAAHWAAFHNQELAQVGHNHDAVGFQVFFDLLVTAIAFTSGFVPFASIAPREGSCPALIAASA